MKIIFISPGVLPMPPVKGGAIENLIEHFIQENETSGENKLIIYSTYSEEAINSAKKYKNAEFRYIVTNSLSKKILRVIRYVLKRLIKVNVCNQYISDVIRDMKEINHYDAVIIENRPQFVIPLSKIVKGKMVQHIHNEMLNSPTRECKRIIDLSDKILTVSDYIKQNIYITGQSEKVTTLHNGINTKLFNKNRWCQEAKDFRNKYGIKEDDIVILYSGRLNENKGVKELLEAFITIKSKQNLKLLIVGSTWFSKNTKDKYLLELQNLASEVKENIVFTGYIDYNVMPIVYASADIAVVPSTGIEAAALVILESRSTGLPLIISDSGGMPEFVNDSCAIIVNRGANMINDLNSSLSLLIEDRELREVMGENARKEILKYDKRQYYDNFNKLLFQLIGNK
jgi:glycosyltransferase involved in cell wall biosynthesis